MVKEIWKDVVGYEGLYKVSNTGKIYAKQRMIKRKTRWGNEAYCMIEEHKISFFKKQNGYLSTNLFKNGEQHKCYIHRIVAEAFIENPQNKDEVNHKDFNKENNNVENLEWCSRAENHKHALEKYKSFSNGKKIICIETGEVYKNSIEAGKKTCISPANIRMAISEKTKNHSAGGYHWKQI